MFMRRPSAQPTPRRRRTMLVLLMIFLIALVTKGIWTWSPYDLNGLKSEGASVSQDDGAAPVLLEASGGGGRIPVNGYVLDHKTCWVVIGQGGLSVQQDCRSWHLLPKWVRRTAGSCAVGVVGAWFGGAPLAVGCFTAALGTIPWDRS